MGWAELIVGNLFLASLIGVLALAVGRGGRRAAAAHALWVMFFVKLITPPIVSVPFPIPSLAWTDSTAAVSDINSGDAASSAEPDVIASHNVSDHASDSDSLRQGERSEHVDEHGPAADPGIASVVALSPANPARWTPTTVAVLTLWFCGFAVVGIRGIVRLLRFRRLLAECGTDDEEATETVRQLLEKQPGFGRWNRVPRVVRVSVRVSPMLFGCAWRPIIVCPDSLWQSLSVADRKAFLSHETAHFYRRDHWIRWLEWYVSAVYWWFPGVYFAQKQLERHEEACCDAWAVKMLQTKPRNYAEALLRVVDFISDHQIGLPGFASGMQPTDSLEERLRLLMRSESDQSVSRGFSWASGMACAAIWMIHPDVYHLKWQPTVAPQTRIASTNAPIAMPKLKPSESRDSVGEDIPLPEPPRGFWNTPPVRNWAGFSFKVSGYRLGAISGSGFLIERAPSNPIVFDERNLTGIAEIPMTGRVIIGDSDGSVRLWDLEAGMPVSLLGRHRTGVSSLSVLADGSVFSGDSAGTVIRWELQSGQALAQWSSEKVADSSQRANLSVQSVRGSGDGKTIAVLCGSWQETLTPKTLYLLDSQTLTQRSKGLVDANTALAVQNVQGQWCLIRWNGDVHTLDSGEPIGRIAKHHVSAMLLSQHAGLNLDAEFDPDVGLRQTIQ